MLNFSLYVSGTLLKGCHLVERILGLPVISSAMISIIILICKYIPSAQNNLIHCALRKRFCSKKKKRHEVLCPDPPAYPARNRFALMIATFLFALLWFASLSKAVGAGLGHGGGIIRKECQSFTNHGHDKTPPTVFNPLSLWLTLPRDMGVSHTLWPPSITRAIPACLRFALGLHKAQKNQNNRAVI